MTYYEGRSRRGPISSLADVEVFLRRDEAHTLSSSPLTSGSSWKLEPGSIRHRIETSSARRSSCWRPRDSATISSRRDSIRHARSLANGATVSSTTEYPGLRKSLAAGAQPDFPPASSSTLNGLPASCPVTPMCPLARFTIPELHREVLARRHCGPDQRRHLVAMVERRCAAALASSQLDLSARCAVCRASRARAGFVCQNVGRDRAGIQ